MEIFRSCSANGTVMIDVVRQDIRSWRDADAIDVAGQESIVRRLEHD